MDRDDIHKIGVGIQIGHSAFHDDKTSSVHVEVNGDVDIEVRQKINDVVDDLRGTVHITDGHGTVLVQEPVDDLRQLGSLGIVVRHVQQDPAPLHQFIDIVFQDRVHAVMQTLRFLVGQFTHHPEIQPYDLAVPDPDIAGVRIRLEELVFRPLLDITADQFRTDFTNVVAGGFQTLDILQIDAVNEFHDQHIFCGVLMIDTGSSGKSHGLQDLGHPFDVIGFLDEVHLFLSYTPGLIDGIFQDPLFVFQFF